MESRELSRMRTLTQPAYETFIYNVRHYEQSFSRIRNDINGLISALDLDVETISEYIRRNFVDYERLTNEYADFLVKSRTFETEQSRHLHMIAFESLRTSVTSTLAPKPDPRFQTLRILT